MSYRASFVKQSNQYTITIANASSSGNVTIAEDPTYSEIDIQGWTGQDGSGGGGSGTTAGDIFAYLTVSGSVVTATRNGSEGILTLKIVVTEYRHFSMFQTVQRGTIAFSAGGSLSTDSSAYTATGVKTKVKSLGWATGASNNPNQNTEDGFTIVKKDSTHATATRIGNNFASTAAFEVVDWK